MSVLNIRLQTPPKEWDENWGRRLVSTIELQIKYLDSTASPEPYIVSNVTTDRTYDADSTTLAEIADVLGTLITDLKNKGVIS